MVNRHMNCSVYNGMRVLCVGANKIILVDDHDVIFSIFAQNHLITSTHSYVNFLSMIRFPAQKSDTKGFHVSVRLPQDIPYLFYLR